MTEQQVVAADCRSDSTISHLHISAAVRCQYTTLVRYSAHILISQQAIMFDPQCKQSFTYIPTDPNVPDYVQTEQLGLDMELAMVHKLLILQYMLRPIVKIRTYTISVPSHIKII